MASSLLLRAVGHCFWTLSSVGLDLVRLAVLVARSHRTLAAENLFLRKQLALFQERKVRPRRANDSTRWIMATLSQMFPWSDALVNVKPDTLIRWHRKGGLPEPTQDSVPASGHRHKLPVGFRIAKKSVLGGLHHEYRLVKEAA